MKLHFEPIKRFAGYLARETPIRGRFRIARWLSGGSPIVRVRDALLEVELGDFVSDHIFAHGAYEPDTLSLAMSLCGPDDWFIDVGAHIGQYSAVLGAMGCQVVGLEPNHATFERYARNMKLNKLDGRVIALPCAVGVDATVGALNLSCRTNSGMSSLKGDGRLQNYAPILPLATILKAVDIGKIALMKIDIEGHELDALKSLSDVHPANIIVEWYGPSQASLKSEFLHSPLWAYCRENGYLAYDIDGTPLSEVVSFRDHNVHLRHAP